MKFILSLFFAVVAFAQVPAAPAKEAPKKARVEGIVLSTTGAPVARAEIILTTTQSVLAEQTSRYTATSGDDGKFVLENIEPTTGLSLTAQKTGFLTAGFAARTANGPAGRFALTAGQSLTNLTLTMTPQSAISGRVTDVNGDPQPGVTVTMMRRGYQGGVRQLVLGDVAATNDQGVFRISNVTAGRYFLRATPRSSDVTGTGKEIPIPTYYPNATDAQGAASVDLAAGQDMPGIEIRLRQGHVYSARGKLVDAAGTPLMAPLETFPQGTSNLSIAEAGSLVLNSTRTRSNAKDGTFVIGNLTPGIYSVQVTTLLGGTNIRSVRVGEFTVEDKDVADLLFRVNPGGNITGTIRLEGGDLQASLPAPMATPLSAATVVALTNAGAPVNGMPLSVGLVDASPLPAAALVKSDNTFVIESVPAGRYYFSVGASPPGMYIKAVRFDGMDVTHAPVNVGSGGGKLDIVLAKNATNLGGTVTNEKGEPQSGVLVSLWTVDADAGRTDRGVRTATTDSTGAFIFRRLSPNTYYAAAWDQLDSGLALARDFLTLLTSRATRVEIKEGGSPSLPLKLVPVAATKAAEEKLP